MPFVRCDCCGKPGVWLYKSIEPGMTYFQNGYPVPYATLVACTDACAREWVYGPRRSVPDGHVLERATRIQR